MTALRLLPPTNNGTNVPFDGRWGISFWRATVKLAASHDFRPRQLRLLHLQPRSVHWRDRGRSAGAPQRSSHGGGDRAHGPTKNRDLAWAVHAKRGWHHP